MGENTMRHFFLMSPFYLMLATCMGSALAHHTEGQEYQGTLMAHEHGKATLNIALQDNTLEIDLDSPAINILGYEYLPSSVEDQALAVKAKQQLEQPLTLFAIPLAAQCVVQEQQIVSPIFNNDADLPDLDKEAHHHLDIEANYTFTCSKPEALNQLDLAVFFKTFPNTHKIAIQYIGNNGQQSARATLQHSQFNLK